jgi:hypothetical protein
MMMMMMMMMSVAVHKPTDKLNVEQLFIKHYSLLS